MKYYKITARGKEYYRKHLATVKGALTFKWITTSSIILEYLNGLSPRRGGEEAIISKAYPIFKGKRGRRANVLFTLRKLVRLGYIVEA